MMFHPKTINLENTPTTRHPKDSKTATTPCLTIAINQFSYKQNQIYMRITKQKAGKKIKI